VQEYFHQLQVTINLEVDNNIMYKCGTNTGYKVINKQSFSAPYVFDGTTEHPEGKHIEKDMSEVAVHEHVSKYLPYMKIGSPKIVQSQGFVQVNTQFGKCYRSKKKKPVDDK
jgi:hypothetical protein